MPDARINMTDPDADDFMRVKFVKPDTNTNATLCPCCRQPMPPKQVKDHKASINARLARLTNPPQGKNLFYVGAALILGEYNLTEQLAQAWCDVPSHSDPFTVRFPIDVWNCHLILQGCYGKMEVAYLS